ncbi:ECF family RNA polymerase sigma factor [Sorangium cellulosum]|uniref:ECF family RNA polymerase sigma factor n=1 Tax=Sorangium cellulosum TaxID=56 RepID=A0A2L0F5N7_SORCE|nr:RNA polymerase sigma factor [Sorangium cellulosum]AUX46811.1 ECF family RNA polymerase sigma factor [Sorangium cellulosum]
MNELALNVAMDRYACGDARAFPELHRALHARLLAYLTRMCSSSTLAGDLTQETFLRMHRARSTFAPGGAVTPWAYAIARNVYVDHMRAQRHRSTERLPSDPGAEPPDTRGADAEAVAMASQTARAIERVLSSIPAAQREAFILLRYEGLSVQDAAAILGATPTAVKLRAFRAYEALRAELEELEGRPEAGTGAVRRADRSTEKGAAAEPERSGRRGRAPGDVRGGADDG